MCEESPDCDIDCSLPVCGDGIVNKLANEECDDGGEDGTIVCQGCIRTGLRAFITSMPLPSTFGGIDKANAICTELADQFDNSPTKSYRAWLSQKITIPNTPDDITEPHDSFTTCGLPIYLPDGTSIAANINELKSKGPLTPININELKQPNINESMEPVDNSQVWTRTNHNGNLIENFGDVALDVSDCNDWSAPSPQDITVVGMSIGINTPPDDDYKFDHWTARDIHFCKENAHLYCFEQCVN